MPYPLRGYILPLPYPCPLQRRTSPLQRHQHPSRYPYSPQRL